MNSLEAIEIGRQTLIVFVKISMPILLISLVIGLIISLFQALTQIQEMTLTFVPKVLVVFGSLIVLMPYMLHTLIDFSNELSSRIVHIEENDDE